MLFSRKRLTDSEYVEQLRKSLGKELWLRRFNIAMGLVFLLFASFMIEKFFGMLMNLAGPGQLNAIAGWFAASVGLGTVAGFMLSKALHLLAGSVISSRSDRLVVDLWDALEQQLKESADSKSRE